MSVKRKVTVPLGSGDDMSSLLFRLGSETSGY
jgi:hypothetical protein